MPHRLRPPMKGLGLLAALLLAAPLLLASPIARVQSNSGQTAEAAAGRVLVKYKEVRGAQGRAQVSGRHGGAVQDSIAKLGVDVVKIPAGQSLESFLAQLRADPNVEYAEPDMIVRSLGPNDPQFGSQYYLPLVKATGTTSGTFAWDITTGTPSVVVAVIDTGITLAHPDIVNRLWVNPSTTATSGLHGATMAIDWNEDGDCTDNDPSVGLDQCAGPTPNDNNNRDGNCNLSEIYHGTHVAGLIAAEANNATNIAGLAPNTRVMAVKALNNCGIGLFSAIANAIVYAADNGADVINMSLGASGTFSDQTVNNAVNYALNRNVVVVAASGNDGVNLVDYPASIDRVVAVGATDSNDALAGFSNTGTKLDLVAPGVSVLSLSTGTSATSTLSGTSFATPLVAAAAALIRTVRPDLSPDRVTQYLDFFADDRGPAGYDTSYGFGRLNVYASVYAALNNLTPLTNPADRAKTFPYPNPFNPAVAGAQVTFSIPAGIATTLSDLKIEVFDISGQKIKSLSGTNTWDGKNDDGNPLATGLYYYFVKTSRGDATGKLTVLK